MGNICSMDDKLLLIPDQMPVGFAKPYRDLVLKK